MRNGHLQSTNDSVNFAPYIFVFLIESVMIFRSAMFLKVIVWSLILLWDNRFGIDYEKQLRILSLKKIDLDRNEREEAKGLFEASFLRRYIGLANFSKL